MKKPTIKISDADPNQSFGGEYARFNDQPAAETKSAAGKLETNPAPAPARPSARRQKARVQEPPRSAATAVETGDKMAVRRVTLIGYPTNDQLNELEVLADQGLPLADMIRLAGRNALSSFAPKPAFSDYSDDDRARYVDAYRTSKEVPVEVLEELHRQGDPLDFKSDGAMLRGQFEPHFRQKLDDLIEDQKKKLANKT
ncbi:hypothetical protein [Notoacmeibacter ruber]|uniref:Uncharacterized protein n=1 Tax=Notoacmeibacter ruber TaxID=2670375 RepID=A0A3L7J8Y7_9HYPH|nr:hypothetical protein [Notoacmeibacter ruber]RLQ84972.1 hypothetical protein D8780_15405 [Notoacmeibacter ruber]